MQVTGSNLTLAMDKITSGPETLFPPPHCVARRSFLHGLGICAGAIMLVFSASGQMAQAADGDLDPTFGTGGKLMTDFNDSTDIANAVALQPDAKLVVAGFTYTKWGLQPDTATFQDKLSRYSIRQRFCIKS